LAGKVIVCQKVDQQEGEVSSYQESSFSEEKEAKRLLLLVLRRDAWRRWRAGRGALRHRRQ
jgi:hypothetical protein